MQEYYESFMASLMVAMKRIPEQYFYFHVVGDDSPIKRERVYCYELYHQLRCLLTNEFPFNITAEPDKRRHPIIKKGINPDLIIHSCGDMARNLVVVEVKTSDNLEDLPKDFETIQYMLAEARYYRGVSLLFGAMSEQKRRKVFQKYRDYLGAVTILFHDRPDIVLTALNET